MDSSSPPSSPVPSRRVQIWRFAGTLISLGLLAFVMWSQGWEEFLNALRELPFSYVLAALGLMMLSRLAVALRWYSLLRSAKVKITFAQSLRLVFMGLFSSNFLPSTVGGDLVRLAGAIYLRLDVGITTASLLVDRLVGMAGMASFLPFGLAAVLRQGPIQSGSLLTYSLAGGMVPLPLFRRLWERGLNFLRGLASSSIYWVQHPASLAKAFLFTLAHMTMTFLTVKVLLAGMGESLSFWSIGGLWSFSYFISLAPISINGLGLQEVSIAYLYSHFGGISIHTGLAIAVMMRMLFLVASLPGVVFLPDILRPLPRRVPNDSSDEDPPSAENTDLFRGING